MRRFDMRLFTLVMTFIFLNGSYVFAVDSYSELGQQYISEKSKITGHLDLYDENIDAVRNLKLLEWTELKDGEENQKIQHGDFRDFRTGDTVEVGLVIDVQQMQVEKARIVALKETTPEVSAEALDKDFTQGDVQAAITDYIEQKSKFTKTFGFFDPTLEKFLKLDFDQFQGDMRRFGVLYIQTTVFVEAGSEDPVALDITVENVNGQLQVQKIKRR